MSVLKVQEQKQHILIEREDTVAHHATFVRTVSSND
jgi:hypothetical protein